MKQITLALCTALLCTTAAADEWTGRGKELHFAGVPVVIDPDAPRLPRKKETPDLPGRG